MQSLLNGAEHRHVGGFRFARLFNGQPGQRQGDNVYIGAGAILGKRIAVEEDPAAGLDALGELAQRRRRQRRARRRRVLTR